MGQVDRHLASNVNFWLYAATLTMALGWLMPNHQLPWTAFHADAWVAMILVGVSMASLYVSKDRQVWSNSSLFLAVLCSLPFLQWGLDLVKLTGNAWVSTLYLLGALLAVLTGARWEMHRSNQLVDALLFSVGVAAVLSVTVQLCQWLGQTGSCLCGANWMLFHGGGSRFFGNFSQPNQLATLLLWGIVAVFWGYLRQALGGFAAIFLASYFVLGLTLTGSRTGALTLSLLVLGAWVWRRMWSSRRIPYVATLLLAIYLTLFLVLEPISNALLLEYSSAIIARTTAETRFHIWRLFLDAVLHAPWMGYGWNQSQFAQVAASGQLYAQAHNLFLDLMLWLGLPLGVLASAAISAWVWQAVRGVRNEQDAVLIWMVLVVAIHAMLEFPMYYAYFLLPTGLLIGTLDHRLRHRALFSTNRLVMLGVLVGASTLLALVIRDYFRVEESYAELRLEKSRIVSTIPRLPPDVVVLTQLRDVIRLARFTPSEPVDEQQIHWIEDIATTYPSAQNLLKLAQALSLHGETTKADQWRQRICRLSTPEQCDWALAEWSRWESDRFTKSLAD